MFCLSSGLSEAARLTLERIRHPIQIDLCSSPEGLAVPSMSALLAVLYPTTIRPPSLLWPCVETTSTTLASTGRDLSNPTSCTSLHLAQAALQPKKQAPRPRLAQFNLTLSGAQKLDLGSFFCVPRGRSQRTVPCWPLLSVYSYSLACAKRRCSSMLRSSWMFVVKPQQKGSEAEDPSRSSPSAPGVKS